MLRSDASDLFVNFNHLRTLAHQLVAVVAGNIFWGVERDRRSHQPPRVESPFNEILDLGNVERLSAKLVGTHLHCFDCGVAVVH